MVEQATKNQLSGDGSTPFLPAPVFLGVAMPELFLEMISTADLRWKQFRADHYIKSYDYQHFRQTGEHRTLNAKEREDLGMKSGERGQQVHFLIWYRGEPVGIISGGSAVYNTATRDIFFGFPKKIDERKQVINSVVNNTVYHLASREKNLFSRVLALWEKVVPYVWNELYEAPVCGFETFVEEEETTNGGRGSGYRATGWTHLGKTAGNAKTHPPENGLSKTAGGKSSRRFGKTTKKDVLCKWRPGFKTLLATVYRPTWQAGEKVMKCALNPEEHGFEYRDEMLACPVCGSKLQPTLTKEGAEQRDLAKERTAKRKTFMGKCFSASTHKLYVYPASGIPPSEVIMEVYDMISRLQAALTPDLLDSDKRREQARGQHRTFGHCYIVTEALYHLYGKSRGYKPYIVRVPEADNTTHWWLQNAQGGRIDATSGQFTSRGIVIPYEDGRGNGFLTKEPSNRCQELMRRAGYESGNTEK